MKFVAWLNVFVVLANAQVSQNTLPSIQFINRYPPATFKSSKEWIEYFATNCSFVSQYYMYTYPLLPLSNITCTQTKQPYNEIIQNYLPVRKNNPILVEMYKTASGKIFNIIVFNKEFERYQDLTQYSDDNRALLYILRFPKANKPDKSILQENDENCEAVGMYISQQNQVKQPTYYELYETGKQDQPSSLVSFGWFSKKHGQEISYCLSNGVLTYTISIQCNDCDVFIEATTVYTQCVHGDKVTAYLAVDEIFLDENTTSRDIEFHSNSDALDFVSNVLTQMGLFNVEDVFVTTCLALTNYISAVFIVIGLTMYHRIMPSDQEEKDQRAIRLVIVFIICGQITVMMGYQIWLFDGYYTQCLSQEDSIITVVTLLSACVLIPTTIFLAVSLCIIWVRKNLRYVLKIADTMLLMLVSGALIWYEYTIIQDVQDGRIKLTTAIDYKCCEDLETELDIYAPIFAAGINIVFVVWSFMVITKQISMCCCCYCCQKCWDGIWFCNQFWILVVHFVIFCLLLVAIITCIIIMGEQQGWIFIAMAMEIYHIPFVIITICSTLWFDAMLLIIITSVYSVYYISGTLGFDSIDPSGTILSQVLIVLLVPWFVVHLFMKIETLHKFWINVVSIYLVVFDVVTDIVLIFNWIQLGHFTWASMQISFILSGQLVAAFGCFNADQNMQKNDDLKRNWLDKLMSLLGLGRAWMVIRSWSDTSENENYKRLYKKHKIYELMYESFPSVTLQIYVALITDDLSVSIVQCIFATFVSMSWSVWIYLVGITRSLMYKDEVKNEDNSIELQTIPKMGMEPVFSSSLSSMNESLEKMEQSQDPNIIHDHELHKKHKAREGIKVCCKWLGCLHVIQNYKVFINVYLFIFTDFIIRAFPMMAIIAIVNQYYGKLSAAILAISLFCGLCILEYFANRWIRYDAVRPSRTRDIILIFMVSVLSSFYSLLSSLNIIDGNKYLTKCVDLKRFIRCHIVRIVFSIVLYGIILVSHLYGSINVQNESLFELLMILYAACLVVNIINILVLVNTE